MPHHPNLVFPVQVGKIGLVLTVVYCVLLGPIMLLYRHTELHQAGAADTPRDQPRKYPPRYEDSKRSKSTVNKYIYTLEKSKR